MDKELKQVLCIIALTLGVVAILPISIGYYNSQLIRDYTTHGMDPYKASCLVTNNTIHCLLAPKQGLMGKVIPWL